MRPLQCAISGIGAWGPGFNSWPELQTLLTEDRLAPDPVPACVSPKPLIIPANERRRAPLPVRAAVEVSSQALDQSTLPAEGVACVFGSGLGDTEITDYMCRVLITAEKQLSPTKFHNSVHNAAAGYWTISTGCMKSANSIAGYKETAGLALLEGVTLCVLEQEPVLVTLFDTAAHSAYQQIFNCQHSFAAAIVLNPMHMLPVNPLAIVTLTQTTSTTPTYFWQSNLFNELYSNNPAAQILALLDALNRVERTAASMQTQLRISNTGSIVMDIEAYS